jgi:uncharacterized protein YydD (DUF2326 family)
MKLLKLSSSSPTFRSVIFEPQGLTLILGDGAHRIDHQEGDSNGVGKTLALKLVHHCLGAQKPPKVIASDTPNWIFNLDIEVGKSHHRITRSGDGKTIALDEKTIKIGTLREWLNEHGGFSLPESSPYSFRALFPRFARRDAADCISPWSVSEETPSQALQRTLYLLGANDELARRKEHLKNELDRLRKELKLFNSSPSIRDVFTAGHKPAFRLRELADQIPKLRDELARFVVAEDFREREKEMEFLTTQLRDIAESISLKEYELVGVRESKTQQSDITKDELLSLYTGLEDIFQPSVLRHLEDVEMFQRTLTTNRNQRLATEETRLALELRKLAQHSERLSLRRSGLIEKMNGRRALDDYAAMSRTLASLEEEQIRLETFVQFDQTTKQRVLAIRAEMVQQDAIAMRYVQAEPLAEFDVRYRALINSLYPEATAGIGLSNNDGQNKMRFNLEVLVQGQDSDGIGNARILCFDWLVFTAGLRNDLGCLWHDNRLFADLDPKPRASWFSTVLRAPVLENRQYIASLNSENFASMAPHLPPQELEALKKRVALTLQGDKDSNRLMGVRFG